MTKRLSDDERTKRAIDRVTRSQQTQGYKTAICKAITINGVCGLDIFKDGRRPWEHVNSTARHMITVDRSTVADG